MKANLTFESSTSSLTLSDCRKIYLVFRKIFSWQVISAESSDKQHEYLLTEQSV